MPEANWNITLIIYSLFIGGLGAYIAERRGRRPLVWGVISVLIGLLGILLLFFLPKIQKKSIKESEPKPIITHDVPPRFRWKMIEWYYLDKDHKQQGAVAFDILKDLWKQGIVQTETLIWSDGMKTWHKIKEIPNMTEVLIDNNL